MRTLIAEDDAANRRLLEVTLTRWGYDVVVTRDGIEAWNAFDDGEGSAAAETPAPELAILDWMMPGMDGPEVCQRIRARPGRPYVYVLLLTSKDQRGDVVAGLDAGADDYLTKPFDPQELQVRLRAGQRILDLQAQLLQSLSERERAEEQLRVKNLHLQEAVLSEHRAHVALKQAQSQMVQTEKLAGLGQMVAGVAHEINNPLAFVSNNLVVLERDLGALQELIALYRALETAPPAEQPVLRERIQALSSRMDLDYTLPNLRDLLARSREGLRRIQQIVSDLRHFARLDSADIQDQEDEVDINAGIVSTLNIIEAQARTKQVRIERELSPRLPPLRGSGAKINQVVMNLVANALDSCGPGGTVTVRTVYDDQADPDTVRIEVSDTGAGIEPAVQERIFDPFFTTKPPGVGTGLGLSISYGIVRDHGGTITVVSAPGQGAHLTVRLPLRRPAGADDSVGGSSGDSDSGSAALS